MNASQPLQALQATGCEVRSDSLTRQLFATDASIYQMTPLAVAFPRSPEEASAVIRAAVDCGVSVTPRGAGTGLTGGAVGDGLVVDFSRHLRRIWEPDLERRTVRVEPGVVLDQLNAHLKPHGFWFGPDVAPSSRATLGGMIGNNSSGARTPVYGTTAEHVNGLEILLADGRREWTTASKETPDLATARCQLSSLVGTHAGEIMERMPPGMRKRWPGYGIERFLRLHEDLNPLFCGSEGTLAAVVSAELRIVPLPKKKALAVVMFDSVSEAMQATVALEALHPAAVEHVDHPLLDQTRGRLAFQAARDLLGLDADPAPSCLIVEFFDDADDKLSMLESLKPGRRRLAVRGAAEMELVWGLRKSALSLITGCKGRRKPFEGLEDTAVRPGRLPEYVQALDAMLQRHGVKASFYGHAASGLIHLRPVVDLRNADDARKYREMAAEISALVRQFRGTLAGEHGLGMSRTQFLPEHAGPALMEVMREIKRAFDPRNVFNPGKIIGDGRYAFDRNWRWTPGIESVRLPFTPVLAFAAKDGGFLANLEQCNGCGGCRKETPVMCPTFIATREEIHSTRGRASTIRASIEGRLGDGVDPLRNDALSQALSSCLSCKACQTECPSGVNLALLKAELHHARIRRDGPGLRERVFSAVDTLGRIGCAMPSLSNAVIRMPWMRGLMRRMLGISEKRRVPAYASERFDRWFEQRAKPLQAATANKRDRVILWDDTFVRYHEPHIGRAAVAVLEAAGFEVTLLKGRKCCGRPTFSQGNLDLVRKLGRHNLDLLATQDPSVPVIFLEPSCWAMFAGDYIEMGLDGAVAVAERCFLFEHFIETLLARDPQAIRFRAFGGSVAIHAHCHAKAKMSTGFLKCLAERLPGCQASLMNTGCCGMAGAFGMSADHYELSMRIGAALAGEIARRPADAVLVASGTSCRHQIGDVASRQAVHMAELLARQLEI
jgi:FAD/FMN-containing dehydrogenase/Fe-S oxidoreductase